MDIFSEKAKKATEFVKKSYKFLKKATTMAALRR